MSNEIDVVVAARAALEKIREGLQEFVSLAADEGEPEVVENALLLFEARGMGPQGIFSRTEYIAVDQNGSRTQMLGMWELLKERVDHDLRCAGDHE